MLLNVYLLAVSEMTFHLLGQNGGGGKTADQLLTAFAALIDPALIDYDRGGDVAIASGDGRATVNVGQHVMAIRYPTAALARRDFRGITWPTPALSRPTISRLSCNDFHGHRRYHNTVGAKFQGWYPDTAI